MPTGSTARTVASIVPANEDLLAARKTRSAASWRVLGYGRAAACTDRGSPSDFDQAQARRRPPPTSSPASNGASSGKLAEDLSRRCTTSKLYREPRGAETMRRLSATNALSGGEDALATRGQRTPRVKTRPRRVAPASSRRSPLGERVLLEPAVRLNREISRPFFRTAGGGKRRQRRLAPRRLRADGESKDDAEAPTPPDVLFFSPGGGEQALEHRSTASSGGDRGFTAGEACWSSARDAEGMSELGDHVGTGASDSRLYATDSPESRAGERPTQERLPVFADRSSSRSATCSSKRSAAPHRPAPACLRDRRDSARRAGGVV
jgi:hypothetical protein